MVSVVLLQCACVVGSAGRVDCRLSIGISRRRMRLCGIRMGSSGNVERGIKTNLGETDIGGLLTEALTADVHLKPSVLATQVNFTLHVAIRNMLEELVSPYAVLADQTGAVGADTAESAQLLASPFLLYRFSIPSRLPPSFILGVDWIVHRGIISG